MDIDEILERAEKVEDSGMEEVEGNELLNQFKVITGSDLYVFVMFPLKLSMVVSF